MRNIKVSERTFKKLMNGDKLCDTSNPVWLRSHAYYIVEKKENYVIAIRRKFDVWNANEENKKTYIKFTKINNTKVDKND
jgi:hypothetical protein